MIRTLIKNVKIVNDMAILESNIVISGDKIEKISINLNHNDESFDNVIDGTGLHLLPV